MLDIGSVRDDGSRFHTASLPQLAAFLRGVQFVCGHNILNHDVKYVGDALRDAGIGPDGAIDTLYLSPLLFPTKPYHALLKDDKLQTEEANNPLHDALKAKDLFYGEVAAFSRTDEDLRQIFSLLLSDRKEFRAFFRFVGCRAEGADSGRLIRKRFRGVICDGADLAGIIAEHPVELAYCLALIDSFARHGQTHSIMPRWVLKNYPAVERIMFLLRNTPCETGCEYCDKALNIHKGLKRFFGFGTFRTYEGERLQEKAVRTAVAGKSLLAVFPTGGGKSVTFQLPALMSGENVGGLTVVISPLQSLMKDQVDNLEKAGITAAVTINGMLDPIERAKAFERVGDGSASILYIAPESLRSPSVERLIAGRKIVRFVIDEAHCFSSWGQDFRVDYLYIGDFIRALRQKKGLEGNIPVSCFTATARKQVIEDISLYFKEKLSIDLEPITSSASRTNLRYTVLAKKDDEEKYQTIRNLVGEKECPTIVYVARTHKADSLAARLTEDGFEARAYHGKMETARKTANQEAFISDRIRIMVATSAFGMGVDKKDVGLVIHHDISDSLENYVQEAGRAGRDERITADCFVLFNEEDLCKHFVLLNQTKLSIREVRQVWRAVKNIARSRSAVSGSALDIAREAGWDDTVDDIETRVTTAIAALEEAKYVRRGQNMPRIFANSIQCRSAQEAIDKIRASALFGDKQKENGVRIIRKLFSQKSRKPSGDEAAESRIDYISDQLGIDRREVIGIVNLLREEKILADAKDLTAFIRRGELKNRSLGIVTGFGRIENFLLPLFDEQERTFNIKEINGLAEANGCGGVDLKKLKTILNLWAIKKWIGRSTQEHAQHYMKAVALYPREVLREKLDRRHELARFIVEFLDERSGSSEEAGTEEVLVEFSVLGLKHAFERSRVNFGGALSCEEVEDALFYLSKIGAIRIEGGFLVVYNRLSVERLERDNKKRYTAAEYRKLEQFYENKVRQIHIVGEYAKKMIAGDREGAAQYVRDYFEMDAPSFLNLYFKGRQRELELKTTPAKYEEVSGALSPAQRSIVEDGKAKCIVVAAGPGSGKTRVLVHKLASLLLLEDVKQEQLLMLTFSRAAATEFKKRLLGLIQGGANYVEIRTFHSYCFDLLGRVGSLEEADNIIETAVEKIKNGEIEPSRITKTALVIDEAQDMNGNEFALIEALMERNEEMRVIAVGDDDQNIFGFRGASSGYMERLIGTDGAKKYELVENYRSRRNLVDFTNRFAAGIGKRLKDRFIVAKQPDNGKIKLVRYHSGNLVAPLVRDILSAELPGTTCVLTKTNEEALQIAGLLGENGRAVRLVQSGDGFSLFNLAEVRCFLEELRFFDGDVCAIGEEEWSEAKGALARRFGGSALLEACNNLIRDFEQTNPGRKYKSDLEMFIRESRLEDFCGDGGTKIFVSTIHKAKGKEFDNVFLLLENFRPDTDEAKRQLYVAMTRAKQNLCVHTDSDFLDGLSAEGMERVEDRSVYPPPGRIAVLLTHRDVVLDDFIQIQSRISRLVSGDALEADDAGCRVVERTQDGNADPVRVATFSRRFVDKTLGDMKRKGYGLRGAEAGFVVYWKKEGTNDEVRIVLPKLYFEKTETTEAIPLEAEDGAESP